MEDRGCDVALGTATVDPATYTYLFDDGSASAAEKERWAAEKAFDDAYHARTVRTRTIVRSRRSVCVRGADS